METVSSETMEFIRQINAPKPAKPKVAPQPQPVVVVKQKPKTQTVADQLEGRLVLRWIIRGFAWVFLVVALFMDIAHPGADVMNFHLWFVRAMFVLIGCAMHIVASMGANADFIVKAIERNARAVSRINDGGN